MNIQQHIVKFWKEEKIFEKSIEKNKNKPTFQFYDGPPFMTGLPHYGHILAGLIKDSVLRFYHNNGFNVPRFAGSDTHGLPIEFEIEKALGIKTTDQVLSYGLGNYNEACRGIVMRCAGEWEDQMGKLGRWIDFKNDYKTMTKEFMNSTWWTFKQLFDKGRVYEGVRIMPYSTTCGTSLSNFETQQNYQEVQDDSLYLTLQLANQFANKTVYLLVWTTTPWTLPANCALCVNSSISYSLVQFKDKYLILATKLIESVFLKDINQVEIISEFTGKELFGLKYIPAFTYNTMQPVNPDLMYSIMMDPYVTDDSGTGIVHQAPSFGEDDYRVCLHSGLINKETKLFQPLDPNGFVSADIPSLQGMFYKNFKDKSKMDLNTRIVMDLKAQSNYFDKRVITHNYPFCWRSDTPLIYRAISSWFIKVEDMRDRLVQLNKQINWVPKSVGSARFESWLGSARDWGVSRSRFWGTPIPIWRNILDPSDIICVESSYELEELAGLSPGSIGDLHRHFIDDIVIKKNDKVYKRIPEILDCWYESGAMPYGALNRIGIVEILRQSDSGIEMVNGKPQITTRDGIVHQILPAKFIAEGLDQTRGWFYTLLVLSASLFDQIPFENVIVNGLVLAEDGKKMSKRLKNYPDPMEVLEEFGSDCMRLYLLGSQATRAEPLKFSRDGVRNMMKEIIIPLSSSINFFKEYYNMYLTENKSSPIINIETNLDKLTNPINVWILIEYSKLRSEYNSFMSEFNLRDSVNILLKLIQILNNGYIKLGRAFLKGRNGLDEWAISLSTLYYVIKYIINDFKAIIPFFTESKYLELKGILRMEDPFFEDESIHLNDQLTFDNYIKIPKDIECLAIDFDIVYNIIFTGLQLRSLYNISVKKPLRSVRIIPDNKFDSMYSSRYKEFLEFILNEINSLDIQVLNYSDLIIDKEIKPNKGLFFKKYGKSISPIVEQLNLLDSNSLDQLIKLGEYNSWMLDESLFNIKNNITVTNQEPNSDYIFKEINFGNNSTKLTVIVDKYYDESIDKLYYYRLVATKIQRARKYAGLHPWDKINAFYTGKPKYPLDVDQAHQIIKSICKINLNKLKESNVFYEKQFDDLDVKLYLQYE